jgi:8-oxo-dGTP pyrophosphatase MutT (NUDIX family)
VTVADATDASSGTGFRRLSQSTLFQGRVFALVHEVFEAPDGEQFDRQIVRHNGAVAVVPVHEDRTVTLIRQYRASIDQRILEIPAGLLDVPGESRTEAARRELREETGYTAASLSELCDYVPAPGLADERVTIFLARDLTFVGAELMGAEEQDISYERIPLADCHAMIVSGAIIDGKTCLGLLMAERATAADG